jgi:hypothetical protein
MKSGTFESAATAAKRRLPGPHANSLGLRGVADLTPVNACTSIVFKGHGFVLGPAAPVTRS